ncbi:TrkH family potassium uptake protein [Oceanobacillus sp. Castelsardo]|uniref:TrkH family potassium uptake protein n=1 Tax=Oceanobacillus sp. Castelsardo TaxID=1851204 RepID=UPI000837D24C|nr:TrkH family potassium uptake protein [Oceanobacillus sp. Castelsardo]
MKLHHSRFHWINKLTPVQILIIFYILAIMIATILLSLPISHKAGVHIPLIDILFVAVSAVSVTGLSTISIVDSLSVTGVFILAGILQLGAVGVMAIGTLIWLLIGKKIGLKERRLIMTDQNQTSFQGMVRLIKQIIYVLLVIELIGFLVLGAYFLQYFSSPGEAFLNGFFGTISAITNGGFDLSGSSLIPFNHDYFVQFINILLIILGAIGFPVLIEVKEFIFAKKEQRKTQRFSLFTKITTLTFFILVVVGTVGIYLLDMTHYFAGKSWHESFFYSLFQSVTTRSAGLSTMDVSLLTEENQLFMSFLMFIGASPSSAGGGIRTTTFALVVIYIVASVRGEKNIRIFNREVYEEDLSKAITVIIMAGFISFLSVLVITKLEPFSLIQIIFEVTSAFGTVGLSMGITPDLSATSKVILMILMLIGRIGIFTFLIIFKSNKKNSSFRYPKERIIIG